MYQIEDLVAREIQNDYRRAARQSRQAAVQAASFQPVQLIRRTLAAIEHLFARKVRHPRPLTTQPLPTERLHRA